MAEHHSHVYLLRFLPQTKDCSSIQPTPNCSVSPSPLFQSSSPSCLCVRTRKFLCKSFIKRGWGGRSEKRRGGGVVGGGRHGFLTIATDKRLQSIEEFPHISWIIGALRERHSLDTNAGYHQDPGRAWSPTAISSFSPSFFFGKWGSCILTAYSPLQFYSSLVPALLPLFPPFFF